MLFCDSGRPYTRKRTVYEVFPDNSRMPPEMSEKNLPVSGKQPRKEPGVNKERQLCKRSKTLMPQNIPVKALQIHV